MKATLKRTLAAGALAVLVTSVLAACNDQPPAPPNPPPASSATPSRSATAPAVPSGPVANNGPNYKMPADTCKLLSIEPFADLYPGATTKLDPLGTGKCNARIGDLPGGLILSVTVEIVARGPAAATGQYEGFKGLDERDYPGTVKNVGGLGSAAYTYAGMLGPVLVVLHGNAYLRILIAKLGSSAVIPPDAADRAAKVARQLLSGLPAA